MSSPITTTSSEGSTQPKRVAASRKKMTAEEKHTREKEKLNKHTQGLIAWGCFDEIIPSDAFLQRLCRIYELWAYNNSRENALFPGPNGWVANKDAMLIANKEEFYAKYDIGEPNKPMIPIQIGFIGYIKCLDDKDIIKKAKAAILHWEKQEYSYDISLASKQAEKRWSTLQHGHTLGAQIVRELKANKQKIIEMLSSENI